jgi:hypothetical protein
MTSLDPNISFAKSIDKYDYDHVGALNAGPIRHLLWFCAGADRQILKHCPQSERIKEEGIGGVVLATAILAFFSSSYAFYVIFVPKLGYAAERAQTMMDQPTLIKAVIAGLVWACIIFNLDRLIVSSGGNDNNDGAKKFLKALPRLLMAAIIGFTLSKPLEIKIMESEIQAELQKVQQQHYEDIIGIENQKYKENLNNIQQRKTEAIATHESILKKIEQQKTESTAIEQENVSKIEKRKAEAIKAREDKLLAFAVLQQKKSEQEKTVYSEAAGDGKTGKAGRGPAWQDAKDNLERTVQETKAMEETLKSTEPQYIALTADFNKQLENVQLRLAPSIAEFNKALANEQKSHAVAIEDFNKQILTEQQRHKDADKQKQDESHQKDGLVERIALGHELHPIASWALTILLLVIELAPVLYKLMLANGPYHYLTENQKACAIARFAIQRKTTLVPGADGGELIVEDVFHQADIILANRTAEITSEGRLSAHAINTFEAIIKKDIDTNPGKFIEMPEQNKA